MPFPEILRELREKKGITQQQLAATLNLSKNAISHYEKDINMPNLDTVQKIADVFNVSVDYLLGRTTIQFSFSALKSAFTKENTVDDFLQQILSLDIQHRTDVMKFLEYVRFHNNVNQTRKQNRK